MGGDRALAPGTDFAGKYTIEGTIGIGGMGIVYRALHRRISQHVAIKMLLPNMLDNAAIVGRFEREARAAGQLRSRHTVRVVDVGEAAEHGPYMVMELLHGQDLGTELEKRGPLPVGEAVEWLLQACSAMAEAHDRGIVHRDLKPANLFLASEGDQIDERVLKVLDFGISKLEDATGSSVTNTSVTMGTPLYMSPEQVRSTKNVDLRSDIWSLGIILYEVLSGKTPFEGAPAAVGAAIVSDDVPLLDTVRRDVSPALGQVVQRALEKKRENRYADARAFAAALQPWSTRPPSSFTKVRPSDPKITVASHDEARAPTLAMGAEAHTPVSAEAALAKPALVRDLARDGKPITAVEWTTGHTTQKKRTGLLVGLGIAAVAVSAGVFAVTRTSAPAAGINPSHDEPRAPPSVVATESAPPTPSAVATESAPPVLSPLPSAVGAAPRPAPAPRPIVSARPKPPPSPAPAQDNPNHL